MVRKGILRRFAPKCVLLALVIGAMSACDKDKEDDNTVEPKSITDIVNENSDFTIFRAAITRAGLATALNGTTLTVFAPNNAAFVASGIADVAAVNAMPEATLKSILEYHVLSSTQKAGDITTGDNQEVTTLGGQKVFITKNATGVSVNGAKVTTADMAASNGVIHVIDRVLMPPSQNLLELAKGNADLSYLVAAVTRASSDSSKVLDALSSTTNAFTVFAPTNQAFIDAGFATEADLMLANPDTLTNILLYHVVPGRVFSSNLAAGDVTTAAAKPIKIDLTDGVKITGAGNGTNVAKVKSPNMLATNGVLHIIDRVLLP